MKIREIIVGTGIAVTSQMAFADIPAGLFNLAGKDSGLCFQSNATMGLVQLACSADSLLWNARQNPDGSYQLTTTVENREYCINVPGVAGADVKLGDCQTARPLNIAPLRDGYRITQAGTELCLNIAGNRFTDGAKLMQFGCTTGDNEKFDLKPAAKTVVGEWSDTFELGLVAIASAILPNGQLVFWSGSTPISFHGDDVTYTGTFNPKGGELSQYLVKDTYEMFCPATVMDRDGSLLIMGGGGDQSKRKYVVTYNSDTNKWNRENDLVKARWYNSAVILGDGSVFTTGGDGDGSINPNSFFENMKGEIWNPDTRSFRYLSNTRDIGYEKISTVIDIDGRQNSDYGLARGQYYRKLAVMHDGSILEYAPYKNFVRHTVEGEGSSTLTGLGREDGPKYIQGATNVQYSADKLLLMGGNARFGVEDYKDDQAEINVSESLYSVYEIDLKTGESVRKENMHHPRYYANSVVMPDGGVFTVGGSRDSHLFDTSEAVYTPEIYDPVNDEWTEVAQHQDPRDYHSTAVLLPDGRIWVAGGGACGAGCKFNYTTAEIYSPPYLFKGDRPEISLVDNGPTGYNGEIGYNKAFDISSKQTISSVALIRLSAVTHSSNTDQRRIELELDAMGNNYYRLTTPLNSNIAPPGYYMLFALNENGVPSEAKMVKLDNSL
ncbi:galactose oxidase-like domain-containing protein [Hahella sp. NBU794]|uniref:galactose oxidase-like domain-containing protein n=1 Tax=Hahella sp. NBU794 TaxID=3422590 RepID=UPI003D6FE3FF